MEKRPKLNLEPPNTTQAKLSLDENEKPSFLSIVPKLDLNTNSEDKKTATQQVIEKFAADFQAHEKSKKTAIEQLYEEIGIAYKNPIFETFKQIEEDKKTFLGGLADSAWDAVFLESKISELEKSLHNPSIASAFKSAQDYEAFTKPLFGSIEHKGVGLAEALATDYKQYLKPEYATAQSALEQFRKTIDSPSIQNTLSHLENFEAYKAGLAYATAAIENNKDLLGSAKTITSLGKSLASDSIKKKMEDHANVTAQIIPKEYPRFELPKTSIIEQNNQLIDVLEITKEQNDSLIEQNSQLIELTKSQSSTLIDISEQMRIQNGYTDKEIQALEGQNAILADQVKDNRKSSRNTMIVAIISILLSAYTFYMSYKASYTIYHLEKNDNEKDNEKLLNTIEDKKIETQKQDQLIKLIEEQNTYLKKLTERESK